MAKPELGTKRLCENCGAKFYDLSKDPIVCPKCGTIFEVVFVRPTIQAAEVKNSAPLGASSFDADGAEWIDPQTDAQENGAQADTAAESAPWSKAISDSTLTNTSEPSVFPSAQARATVPLASSPAGSPEVEATQDYSTALFCAAGFVAAIGGTFVWALGLLNSSYSLQLTGTALLALGSVLAALMLIVGEQIASDQIIRHKNGAARAK